MYSEKSLTVSGKHLICDIKNIQNMDLLNDVDKIKELFDIICEKYDFNVLQKMQHVFEPQGCTIIYLLSESHLSIHTFPERKYAAVDLYTCRVYDDNSVYKEIYDEFISNFDATPENIGDTSTTFTTSSPKTEGCVHGATVLRTSTSGSNIVDRSF